MKTTTVLLLALAATTAAAQTTPAAPAASAATTPPAMPAATASPTAKATTIALVNPGFESTRPGINGNPEGWSTFQHAGPVSFDFALDSGVKQSGTQSMRIKRIGPEVYGTVAQVVPAEAYAGRRVRLTAWMKTEVPAPVVAEEGGAKADEAAADAPQRGARSAPQAESREGRRKGGRRGSDPREGASLMLIALRGSSILESELMQRSQVRGTTPWTQRSIELSIPKQANNIEIGAMLQGPGTVWIDEVKLEVVDP